MTFEGKWLLQWERKTLEPAEPLEQGKPGAGKSQCRGARRDSSGARARAAAPRDAPKSQAPARKEARLRGPAAGEPGSRGQGREPAAAPLLIHQPDEEQRRALGPLFAFSPIIAAP